jgi:8-amino-7-oxononanoate synthase
MHWTHAIGTSSQFAMADVFDRLIETNLSQQNAIVHELVERGCLYDNIVTQQQGRRIQVRGRWLDDFASCNYLGLDLRHEVMDAIAPAVHQWGTHPSWARMAASPLLYEQLETKLAEVLGAEDALVLPTITLIAIGLLPALAGKDGVIFADKLVHAVNYQGCRLARDMGAKLFSFVHSDLDGLERRLQRHADAPTRIIVVDGILSTTGRTPDIPRLAALARQHDTILYIDDAHGFGVLGENPTPERPYGQRGNGVVRHFGLNYDNILYVSGLSKAYSSLAAFIACPKKLKTHLKCTITAYLVSGPVPTAALATALAGLELNDREGDLWRDQLYAYASAIIDGYRKRGIATDSDNRFPIVSAYVGSAENVIRGGQMLFDEGIYLTLQAYPLVPRDKGVLRATPTVANTWVQVEHLLEVMERVVGTLSKGD